MLHDEWRGNAMLMRKKIKEAGLEETENEGELKTIMRQIIICRYIELMTVDETLSKLMVDYNIEISIARYYRLLHKAINLLEK